MAEKDLTLTPLKVSPYKHQQQAIKFACRMFGISEQKRKTSGVALLMQMGTGKSLTAIGIAGTLYEKKKITKMCVVALLSILSVWEEEFDKFANFPYTLLILKGTAKKKQELLKNFRGKGLLVVVVNYETAWRMEKDIIKWGPSLVVADEGHKMKEARTAQSKGMHAIGAKAEYKLLLTGTPISNKEMDIFSQYKFLEPGVFGTSFFVFRNRYFDMGGYGGHVPIFKESMREDYLARMHGVEVVLFTGNGKGGRGFLTNSLVTDFQNEYPTIRIKPNPDCHDRLIILDYREKTELVYHCGASSKDAGKKLCAINQITETAIIHPVIDRLLSLPDKQV